MVRLAPDELSTPLKYREGTISTPFRKIFAIICLSPVFSRFFRFFVSPVFRPVPGFSPGSSLVVNPGASVINPPTKIEWTGFGDTPLGSCPH
jgi:hypothetical protein